MTVACIREKVYSVRKEVELKRHGIILQCTIENWGVKM
jgi:hypothetical protein